MDKDKIDAFKPKTRSELWSLISEFDSSCEVLEKSLYVLVSWAVESGFGWDNIGEDLYEKYKYLIKNMGYSEGIIYAAKREAIELLDQDIKERQNNVLTVINEHYKMSDITKRIIDSRGANCPNDIGLIEHCGDQDCKKCWEIAINKFIGG